LKLMRKRSKMKKVIMIALCLVGFCLILISCSLPKIWLKQREYLYENWCAEQDSVKKYWEQKQRKGKSDEKSSDGTGDLSQ